MKQQHQLSLPVFVSMIIFMNYMTRTCAQAEVSTLPGPTDITKILKKAGQCTTFLRLLKSTKLDAQINTQVSNTNDGMTVFVPTDDAFTKLKSGSLNTYSEEQKDELLEFHILPFFFSISQLETVSNPLHTQVGTGGRFLLNVTVEGNQVNVTTGVVNASVINTLYTDNQLAVYQVDKVLFPLDFVLPQPPAPAPTKPMKKTPSPDSSSSRVLPADSSDAFPLLNHGLQNLMFLAVSCFAVFSFSTA